MEIILVLVIPVAVAAVAYVSTCDLHPCTHCKNTGSEEFGMMQKSEGPRTLFNPRGQYWTHNGCIPLSTKR